MFFDRNFLEKKPAWLNGHSEHSEVVIASRIRLARNLKNIPFPNKATTAKLDEVVLQFQELTEYEENFHFYPMHRISNQERQLMMERRIISPELARKSDHAAIGFDADEIVAMMINEEDHLRLQVLDSALDLHWLWKQVHSIERELDQKIEFSYSDQFGYLTSCPSNIGTGLRISLLMHLPGLQLGNQLEAIFGASEFQNMIVRGFYGEGSDVIGSIFQIANKITLGWTEMKLVDDILKLGLKIVDKEQEARQKMQEEKSIEIEDQVFRSLGILQHARIISSTEFIKHFSNLLFGIEVGLITEVEKQDLFDLLLWTQPAHLQWYYGKELSSRERDIIRAEMIKNRLRL